MNSIIYWIGFAVCAAGGVGLAALLLMWALEKAMRAAEVYQAFFEFVVDRARRRQSPDSRPPRRRASADDY